MGRVTALLRNAATLLVGVAVTIVLPSAGALARAGIKDVRYRGLTLRVPASWPVFRLTAHSQTCVRFNRHAVYLGTPSLDQVCPAGALGRTEAILAQPAPQSSSSVSGPGALVSNPTGGELRVVRDKVLLTATWGDDPGVVERVLGLDSLPQQTPDRPPVTARVLPFRARAATTVSSATASSATATSSASGRGSTYTGLAFDTCSAPTATQLSAWKHSPYRGMGVYIGGANAACAQPNLTSSWVTSVTGAGWHLMLIYVGLQAPKNTCGCAPIHPASAAAEGSAAADDAATRAAALGIGPGSPIYFDMEGYTERPRIRDAVLSFLAAWTSELHHDGYRSGVYSSAGSGIADLVSRYGSGYPEPDDLWFADWNGQASTTATDIPGNEWGSHQRAHQFLGAHNLKYGGLKMNVDSDYVDAATVGTASSSPAPSGPPGSPKPPAPRKKPPARKPGRRHHHSRWLRPTPQPAQATANGALVEVRGTHTVYRIVGGAPLLVKYWQDIGGRQPVRQISQGSFNSLRAVPANGTLIYTATGTVYRIAGGFPFVLNRPETGRSGAQLVDLWDIDHLFDPQVHLHAVPSDGTVIRAAPSGRFWAFENGHLFPARHTRDAVPVPGGDLGPWLPRCSAAQSGSGGAGLAGPCGARSDSLSSSGSGGGGL